MLPTLKHARGDSFAPQDFLSQEGSVREHRKTNWWFALHSDNKEKTEGESTKSSKDNSTDRPGSCNYKYKKKGLIPVIVLMS